MAILQSTVQPAASDPTTKPSKQAADIDKAKKAQKAVAVVASVNSKAISADVGPKALAAISAADKDEVALNKLQDGIRAKRYDALSSMTMGIINAVKIDQSINLNHAFLDPDQDKDAQSLLNDQLNIALGIRERVEVEPGKWKLQVTPAASKFFPTPKDKKGSSQWQAKKTVQSNFAHMLKKCAQAAAGLLDKGIVPTIDQDTGTLKITGPEVKSIFGQSTVLLNEKKKTDQEDKDGKPVELKEKPSFTFFKQLGERKRGKMSAAGGRVDSRAKTVDTTSDEAFGSICNTVIAAINKISGTPSEGQIKVMTALKNVITAKLG